MKAIFARLLTLGIRNSQERRFVRKRLIAGLKDYRKIKLIMTLVVKNEEDIIEQNIRFHCAMGADGFIVLNHNSTDRTAEILEKLKKEGLVLEVINKTDIEHKLKVWVGEMVDIAKNKYKAEWVINADADEFYYSKSLNLKRSIANTPCANLFWLDSNMLFPDDRKDFLTTPYFVDRLPHSYEKNILNLGDLDYLSIFTDKLLCPKVIIKVEDLKALTNGNHSAEMINEAKVQASDIVLYHFHMKNYEQLQAKVIKWQEAAKLKPKGNGWHLKNLIKLYEDGKLREYYDSKYGATLRKELIEKGIIKIDNSIATFFKHKGIV